MKQDEDSLGSFIFLLLLQKPLPKQLNRSLDSLGVEEMDLQMI